MKHDLVAHLGEANDAIPAELLFHSAATVDRVVAGGDKTNNPGNGGSDKRKNRDRRDDDRRRRDRREEERRSENRRTRSRRSDR